MSRGKAKARNISSYDVEDAPRIDVGGGKGPGWVYSVARNEWEKFDKLKDTPVEEEDYFVGKGFSVYYPKSSLCGAKIYLKGN